MNVHIYIGGDLRGYHISSGRPFGSDIPLHSTDGGSPILFCPVMGITLYSLALAAQLHAKDLHTSSACHAQPVEAFYSSIFEVKGTCSLLDHVPQI